VPGTKTTAEVIADLQDETTRGKISWAEFCEAAAKLTPDDLARQLWNALLKCANLRQSRPLATPQPHPQPKRSRKRLRTPQQVVREIRDTISDLSSRQIDSGTARTKLYALQTLLVAMKMAESMPENTPKLQRRGSQLSLPAPPDEE
jgi:hypothetical protein